MTFLSNRIVELAYTELITANHTACCFGEQSLHHDRLQLVLW